MHRIKHWWLSLFRKAPKVEAPADVIIASHELSNAVSSLEGTLENASRDPNVMDALVRAMKGKEKWNLFL